MKKRSQSDRDCTSCWGGNTISPVLSLPDSARQIVSVTVLTSAVVSSVKSALRVTRNISRLSLSPRCLSSTLRTGATSNYLPGKQVFLPFSNNSLVNWNTLSFACEVGSAAGGECAVCLTINIARSKHWVAGSVVITVTWTSCSSAYNGHQGEPPGRTGPVAVQQHCVGVMAPHLFATEVIRRSWHSRLNFSCGNTK